MTHHVLPVAVGLLMTACATVPAGPSVMVLPGNGKNFEQFQADDAVCRQWAAQQTGTTTKRATTESAVSGAAIGTVLGAAAGAVVAQSPRVRQPEPRSARELDCSAGRRWAGAMRRPQARR